MLPSVMTQLHVNTDQHVPDDGIFQEQSVSKICCVQYTQTMILCQMAVHNVEAWYTENIEGWWEVIYYELHNVNCGHQYNQTVVVVPEFALPVELLCWQFKEYAYSIILCIASLTLPITDLENAISQNPVALLHQSLLFVCVTSIACCLHFFVVLRR